MFICYTQRPSTSSQRAPELKHLAVKYVAQGSTTVMMGNSTSLSSPTFSCQVCRLNLQVKTPAASIRYSYI